MILDDIINTKKLEVEKLREAYKGKEEERLLLLQSKKAGHP